jgi:hypothetical protein
MTGYSLKFALAVNETSDFFIGVRLGQYCIKKDIPVMQVAEHFGVSRTAVYAWFLGHSEPNKYHQVKITKYLKKA